jgi:NAD-dependent DNA ligase
MTDYMQLSQPSKFSTLTPEVQLETLLYFQNTYENNLSEQIDDALFDTLVAIYQEQTGLTYSVVGATPSGNKDTLPYYLGSLDKAKGKTAEADIERYLKNYPDKKIVEDKIDGNSGLYLVRYINGRLLRKLYTRGNGYVGTDISHLLNYINLPIPEFDIVVRGELVIPLSDFDEYVKDTPPGEIKLKNARNAGSGVINSKEVNETLAKSMRFFAYNILDWPYDKINAERQLCYLEKLKFDVPWYREVSFKDIPSDRVIKILEEFLKDRRVQAPYDIDGLVIADNAKFYPIEEGHNPRSMIAFKVDVFTTTTVKDIVWSASKDGVLKPVVIYEPVNVSGVTMTRASGKNAKFITENNLGIGSEILVTRAGDVIPDIVDVLTPGTMKLPTEKYVWNDNKVEFVLEDIDTSNIVQQERIEYFMKTMDIKNVGPGRVSLLYDNGFDTIYKILAAKPEDFAKIEGLGMKSGKQMYDNIQAAIHQASLANLMAASGVFGPGFGVRKMEAVLAVYPDILEYSDSPIEELTAMINRIPGFDVTSSTFAYYLPSFVGWLKIHTMIEIDVPEPVFGEAEMLPGYVPMVGLKIVFTGFRSSELEDSIKQRGGNVSSSVNKNTSFLVAKDPNDLKGKGEKAQSLGVPIVSLDEFRKIYNL